MAYDWWTHWHGEPPLSTGGSGSTSMSTGVTLALSTKASLGHTHPQSDITGLTAALSTKSSVGHGHVTSEITNLDSTLANLASQISTKAAGSHTHITSEVTNLDSTLANLASQISTKAAGTHTHVIGDVTNLASTIAGLASQISTKAAGSHTHVTADVTGLDSALSTKASLASGLVPTAQLGSSAASNAVFLRGDQVWAAPVVGIPSTWVKLTGNVLTGSTTMQSVTGLSFSISSAAYYRFEFVCGFQTISSATGFAIGINGPASPTVLAWQSQTSTGQGPLVTKGGRAFGAQTLPTPGSSAANIDEYVSLDGVVRNGVNAGTLQLQFASEVAGSTVSVRSGSVGFLWGPL